MIIFYEWHHPTDRINCFVVGSRYIGYSMYPRAGYRGFSVGNEYYSHIELSIKQLDFVVGKFVNYFPMKEPGVYKSVFHLKEKRYFVGQQ